MHLGHLPCSYCAEKFNPKQVAIQRFLRDGLVLHIILRAALKQVDRKGIVRQGLAVGGGRVALTTGKIVNA